MSQKVSYSRADTNNSIRAVTIVEQDNEYSADKQERTNRYAKRTISLHSMDLLYFLDALRNQPENVVLTEHHWVLRTRANTGGLATSRRFAIRKKLKQIEEEEG